MSRKRPSLIARFFFLLNNLLVLITWAAYLAWFINPSVFPFGGMLALAVPAFILANGFFIIFWLIFFRRYVWLSIITVALGFWHISGLMGFNFDTESMSAVNTFRVMTYNTQYYYANHPWKNYADVEDVKAFVREVNPDILCMQEFQDARKWVPNHKLKHRFISKHATSHLVIYSAYPIVGSSELDFPDKSEAYEKFIYADILKGEDTIRVITAHLAPFRLENQDLSNIKNFEDMADEDISKSSQKVFRQLKWAYKKRGDQVIALNDFIETSPYPVILCGDLNDTPTSYAYRKLTNRLTDSFEQAGSGFGTTHVKFAKNNLPLRIDHILIDSEFKAANWQVAPVEFSDHYPVYADITLKY